MISAAADLARRLARDAEAVCRHYLSKGRRSGRYWIVGDVQNTPGPQPLCAARRSRLRSRRRRQMDRCRHRRARRSARPDRPQPRSARSRRGHGRGAPLSRPAASCLPPRSRAPARPGGIAGSGPPPVPRRPSRSRHPGRGLSARPRHHRTPRLAGLALPPVGLLPRRRECSARAVARLARRRHCA